MKARKEREVDDKSEQAELLDAHVGEEEVAVEVTVVIVTEAEVKSVQDGQQEVGKAEAEDDLCLKLVLNRELLIMKCNSRYIILSCPLVLIMLLMLSKAK